MGFKPGNKHGRGNKKARDFEQMLRIATSNEIEAGRSKLRAIAEKLTDLALSGEMQAIKEIADRLDGKPAQTVDMNVEKRTSADYTRDELVTFLTNAANSSGGTAEEDGLKPKPDSVH